MKKFVNFRPVVVLLLSLMLGIIFATFVFVGENLKLVFLILSLLFFVSLVILYVIFKKKMLVFLSVAVLLFMIPISVIYSYQKTYNHNMKYMGEELVVTGRICENYTFTKTGYLCLTIDNIQIIGANFKDDIDGKIKIYAYAESYDLTKLNVGRFISCFGTCQVNNFNDGSKYSLSSLSNNVVMSVFAKYASVEVKDKTKIAFDEKARDYVYQKLQEFDVEYAEIGYGIMFGKSTLIDEDIVDSFRTTGIAHILSVSGLHISLIASVMIFILSKLKTSNYANLIIMLIIFTIYAYFCDFSVSVVRASIMSILFLYFKARQKCYDALSSLSLSALLILLFKPLKLYSVSFILSYMAVLSIILLAKLFERLLSKCCYKKFAQSLAVILAVQLGLVFTQFYFFEKYSPVSIICNFITIPISSVAFVVLIFGLIVSLVLPFMAFVLKVFDFLMGVVVRFNFTLSKNALVFGVSNLNFLVVLLGLAFIILLSDYIFVKKRYKAVWLIAIMTAIFFVWKNKELNWTRQNNSGLL